MSKAPFWPVATDALVADTMHLSTEEFGAYVKLMLAQWRSGGKPLPADDNRLARMAGLTPRAWQKMRETIGAFFQISDAGWNQKRIEKDFTDVIEKIEKNRVSGSLGGKSKSLKNKKPGLANATIPPDVSPEQTASEIRSNYNYNQNYIEEDTSSLRSDVCAPPQAAVAPPPSPGTDLISAPVVAVSFSGELDGAVKAYNDVAASVGWPVAQHMTPKRKITLKARLRDVGGLSGWQQAMARARASPFLRGDSGRDRAHANWTPDLDFFLQQGTFTKLMEGKYDDRGGNAEQTGFAAVLAGARAALDEYKMELSQGHRG